MKPGPSFFSLADFKRSGQSSGKDLLIWFITGMRLGAYDAALAKAIDQLFSALASLAWFYLRVRSYVFRRGKLPYGASPIQEGEAADNAL